MRLRFLPFATLLVSLAVLPAPAATIYVSQYAPGPTHDGLSWQTAYQTIQMALYAAKSGDEVWVSMDIYRETLTCWHAGVSLYGGFRGTETERPARRLPDTIITPADPLSPNVTILSVATDNVLDGFSFGGEGSQRSAILCRATGVTISNCSIGNYKLTDWQGGAIFCDTGSSVTLRKNFFHNNQARDGGAIFARGATLSVIDNDFEDNAAAAMTENRIDYTKDARGGAIAVSGGAADIRDNRFDGNHARDGGGVWAGDATVTFERNGVFSNGAEKEAPATADVHIRCIGGGLALENCTTVAKNNVFAMNRVYSEAPLSTLNGANAYGGALAVLGGQATIANNTLANNTVFSSGVARSSQGYSLAMGGGVYSSVGLRMANNIFTGNEARSLLGFAIPIDGALYALSSSDVQNNLFFQNVPEATWLQTTESYGSFGNIWADPRFNPVSTNPAVTDYRLAAGSPAIDRGDNAFVANGDTDQSGAPRIQGPRVDIGAFEVAAPLPPARVFVAPSGKDINDGTSWATAKGTVQGGLLAVGPGGEVWVQAGTYRENLLMYGNNGLYGGFQGNESSREQRDPTSHVTVLDGNQTGSVLVIPSTVDGAAVDGFTISNGWHTADGFRASGGGIRTAGRNVVIAHNVIENNTVFREERQPEASGGGIAVNGGSASVLNNVIRNNSAVAVSNAGSSYPYPAAAFGAGLDAYQATVTLANNLVVGNMARTSGTPQVRALIGGLSLRNTGGLVVNNTIAENAGVGLYALGTTNVNVVNSIIAFNAKGVTAKAPVILRNSCLYGNPNGNIADAPDPTGANGNIGVNPLFVNAAAGDYRLQPFSPCRDTGEDAAAVGSTDLAGNPRYLGVHVDLGAYEWAMSGSYTVGDAVSALRIAAGLNIPDSALFDWLDVDSPRERRIDMADVMQLLRLATDRQ